MIHAREHALHLACMRIESELVGSPPSVIRSRVDEIGLVRDGASKQAAAYVPWSAHRGWIGVDHGAGRILCMFVG